MVTCRTVAKGSNRRVVSRDSEWWQRELPCTGKFPEFRWWLQACTGVSLNELDVHSGKWFDFRHWRVLLNVVLGGGQSRGRVRDDLSIFFNILSFQSLPTKSAFCDFLQMMAMVAHEGSFPTSGRTCASVFPPCRVLVVHS